MSRRPRILLAVDKFKGCLSGRDVAERLRSGLQRAAPNAEIRLHPVADGGEGFATELVRHGFAWRRVGVHDALGRPTAAGFATRGDTAVIEMAEAAGLAQIPLAKRRPLFASTTGLGELVVAAATLRPARILIGAGGSATSDGGAGVLAALGARLFTANGCVMTSFGPSALREVGSVDLSALAQWQGIAVEVATDVTSPLLGPAGAAAVFGPQKGANADEVLLIEAALTRWADVLEAATGAVGRGLPGAGAAGGLAFGLALGMGARLVDGLHSFAELTDLRGAISWADVVVTGEGSLDAQTMSGKAPYGVLRIAQAAGKPCWVVAGRSDISEGEARQLGYAGSRTVLEMAPSVRSSFQDAGRWLERIGERLATELVAESEV